jgi:hypothetical protein
MLWLLAKARMGGALKSTPVSTHIITNISSACASTLNLTVTKIRLFNVTPCRVRLPSDPPKINMGTPFTQRTQYTRLPRKASQTTTLEPAVLGQSSTQTSNPLLYVPRLTAENTPRPEPPLHTNLSPAKCPIFCPKKAV